MKHSDFRVVLTVLKSNARLDEHKTASKISVQAIAGHLRMHVQDKVIDLPLDTCRHWNARLLMMSKPSKTALFRSP